MVQINFSITLNPRFLSQLKRGASEAGSRASDVFLRDMSRDIRDLVREEAPHRTGHLRSMIKIKNKRKSGGGVDRRANFKIESTASYSRHVIAGARPSIGDGSPGTGKFFGPGGFGFPATRGFTGKTFRSSFGFYPGFPPNDFITKGLIRSRSYLRNHLVPAALKATSASYNKLEIKFGVS